MNEYAGRIARLQAIMREQQADLAVLSFTNQMRYLTGYVEGGHERLLALFVPVQGDPAFVVPSLNVQHARQNPAGVAQVVSWTDATGWQPAVQNALAGYNLPAEASVLIDDELSSAHLLGLQSLFPGFRCKPGSNTFALLRGVKTDAELANLETAAQLIDTIFEETVAQLREGMTEAELAEFVLSAIKRHNSKPSFSPLICFGANTSRPHHDSGATQLKKGDMVIIDIGCTTNHYCSDITRAVAFGEPSDPDAKRVYGIVNQAHWAARNAVKPGATCEAVDIAARSVIEQAGYGAYFVHRTGHGIGLSGHEPPDINTGVQTVLEPGMCFSVEPGIYLEGRFGVRIENIVTVTAQGGRSLNADAAQELRIV